jgi:hypothetical protein
MPRAQDAQERRVSVSHGTPIVRCDYVQDERYIAKSTWMCGAIVHGRHNYGFLPPLSPVIKEEY